MRQLKLAKAVNSSFSSSHLPQLKTAVKGIGGGKHLSDEEEETSSSSLQTQCAILQPPIPSTAAPPPPPVEDDELENEELTDVQLPAQLTAESEEQPLAMQSSDKLPVAPPSSRNRDGVITVISNSDIRYCVV